MKITQKKESNHKANVQLWPKVNGITVILLILLSIQSTLAQGPPAKGVSADKWLEDLRAANKGKWNEKWFMTGQIRYLSATAMNYLSDHLNEGTDCQRAAANVGHAAAFQNFVKGGFHDMGKGAILTGKEIAEALSPATTLKKLLLEAAKKGAEWLIKYMQELLAKEKAEVHITRANRDNCQMVFVSIWDKAASKYEVIIYGNCGCAPLNSFTPRGKVKVNTFEIRLSGKATIGLDETNENLVLKADVPNSVKIDCDTCKANAPVIPAPKPPVETTPQPPVTPPVVQTPCKPPPPCKECMELYERIVAGCDRIKEINDEQSNLATQLRPWQERKNSAAKDLAELQAQGASVATINAKRAELQKIEKQVNEFTAESSKLRTEQGKLETEIKGLKEQLKGCEKDRCGKTVTGGGIDPCLVGTWRSEPGGGGIYGSGGIVFTIKPDGMATFEYDGMKPFVKPNQFGGGNATLTTKVTGKAAGKISSEGNKSLGVAGDFTSSVTEKESSSDGTSREFKTSGFFPGGAQGSEYTCTKDTLTLFANMKFKKAQ